MRAEGVAFTEHFYTYEERGGTRVAAAALGVPEHCVIKTLVMEDESNSPLIVLMHGDLEVSTRNLARATGRRSVTPASPEAAQRHTGYMVGGISPFGTRKKMPVHIERTILDLDTVFVNGGSRGFLVGLAPAELARVLQPVPVAVGISGRQKT